MDLGVGVYERVGATGPVGELLFLNPSPMDPFAQKNRFLVRKPWKAVYFEGDRTARWGGRIRYRYSDSADIDSDAFDRENLIQTGLTLPDPIPKKRKRAEEVRDRDRIAR